MTTTPPLGIELRNLVKRFGPSTAANGLNLHVKPGEFFSLLGPSGCGKTTALRLIAGFESADEGSIIFGDLDVTNLPVHLRKIGMVFQSYALLPHRTVSQNVAFGLRMQGVPTAEIELRVKEALKQVALEDFGTRMPSELSGGQQQRVALARAIVVKPAILLCDEPFSALDRKLRLQMQVELRSLQKSLGITLIFVTHDQEEAMAMSDRIAVMNKGRIEQIGAPTEIYRTPNSLFVAGFIGDMNLLEGDLSSFRNIPAANGSGISLAIRPEKISISPPDEDCQSATVMSVSYLGGSAITRLALDNGQEIIVRQSETQNMAMPPEGARVGLSWRTEDVHMFEH